MQEVPIDLAKLQKEIDYYKRRLDDLTADNLKHEYSISNLQHQLKQRRHGFQLLSELSHTVGGYKDPAAIFEVTAQGINATLVMDRTIVLVPAEKGGSFRPLTWIGYPAEQTEGLQKTRIEVPAEFLDSHLLANGAAVPTPFVDQLRSTLALPFFVAMPIVADKVLLGIVISGRLKETKPRSPQLDDGDVDTFRSIAGLIGAAVRNLKVAVLEEMDRVKTEFFANISHEFRTPITLTLGPLEGIAAGRYGAVSEGARSQIEIIQRNQRRLLSLINQILDLAKLEAGKMELKASRIANLNLFVDMRATQFRSMAESRGLELRVDLDPRVTGADVYVDGEKFDKVVFNLLSNALKFTKSGHVEIATRLGEASVQMKVSDSGIGIRADQVPNMFQRFRQADGSASREYAGTGIGLALVKEIVQLHGGHIGIESEYGKGTSFLVTLPLGRAHLGPGAVIAAEDDFTPVPSQPLEIREGAGASTTGEDAFNAAAEAARDPLKPVVLYVDDNPDLRQYVRGVLAPNYTVFLAVNGADGLEKARQLRPDLILSDLMMPVMTGTQLCQAVRTTPELDGLPFVLLTAKSGQESKIEGLEVGADDYLNKPFSEPELLARVKNLITMRRQQLRLRRELEAAREIQRTLLPPLQQTFGGSSLDALYHPCEELSGDFFDSVTLGGWLYFYLADVTSHGTAAAQVTYLIKSMFREALHGAAPTLGELMRATGQRYAGYGLEYDVGIQVARLNLETRSLEYTRGNAPLPILVRAGVASTPAAPPGPSLSVATGSEQEFRVTTLALEPGDQLYLVTDGSYEFDVPTPSGAARRFGYRKLMRLIEEEGGAGWEPRVLSALAERNGRPRFEDDITILRLSA